MVESFAPSESANTEVSATPKAHPHFPEERSHNWCLEHSVSQQRGFTKSHCILPGRRGGRGGGEREVILGKVRQNQAGLCLKPQFPSHANTVWTCMF